MKVLIAEEVDSARRLVELLLQRWGYTPVSCRDGAEAWTALRKPDAPRMAILDWEMPGLTGPEICRRLQRRPGLHFVYTVLLTGKLAASDMLEGLDAGAYAYVGKPIAPEELLGCLKVGRRVLRYESVLARKNEQLKRLATKMEALAMDRAQQLIHAERMATLGTMSAGIAHEINNSTSVISGNVQTLQRFWPLVESKLAGEGPADEDDDARVQFVLEEVPKILSAMRKGVGRVAKIVQGLKDYSRSGFKHARALCSVNEAIQESLDLCENAKKLTSRVVLDLDPELPKTVADMQQLEQVFVNLIVNACDAMGERTESVLEITTRRKGDSMTIVFEDNGPGIPEELLEKIWDPFFTTKGVGKGTGLGLSISQGLIEDHGGRFRVENRAAGGACFTITLPIRGNA